MTKTKGTQGFTLLEAIITASLVVVVGLAVYSVLNSGLKIWQRLNKTYIEEDASIFFDKLSTDLRNSFEYKDIDFRGAKDNFEFATLVVTASNSSGLKRGPGQVIYRFNPDKGIITKEKRNLSSIYRQEQGLVEELFKNVQSFIVEYYFYDPLRKEYFWTDEWKEKKLPLAIRIKMELTYGNERYQLSRTFDIPVGTKES